MGHINGALWYVNGDGHVVGVYGQWHGNLRGEVLVVGTRPIDENVIYLAAMWFAMRR
jgi:hypothetical protein